MPTSPHTAERQNSNLELQPEQIIKDNYGWMLALATRIVGDRSLGEDVVQEALIKAVSNLGNLEKAENIKAWLRRITVNNAINRHRKTKSLAEDSFNDHQPEFDNMNCRIEPKWGALATPEVLLSQKNTYTQIERAFESIPESHALIVKLRDVEGYDTKEVAELLEISESNVKVRLHRARSALKKILEPVLKGEE